MHLAEVHSFLIDVMLYLSVVITVKVKLEVKMKTIAQTVCVVGGVALLGQSGWQ